MEVVKLFNDPHVIWQSADDEHSLGEPSLAVHVDACGLIVVCQEGREILVNRATVPEFCRLLKALSAKHGAAS